MSFLSKFKGAATVSTPSRANIFELVIHPLFSWLSETGSTDGTFVVGSDESRRQLSSERQKRCGTRARDYAAAEDAPECWSLTRRWE